MDAVIIFIIGLVFTRYKSSTKVEDVDIPVKMNDMHYKDEDAFNRYPKLLLK